MRCGRGVVSVIDPTVLRSGVNTNANRSNINSGVVRQTNNGDSQDLYLYLYLYLARFCVMGDRKAIKEARKQTYSLRVLTWREFLIFIHSGF